MPILVTENTRVFCQGFTPLNVILADTPSDAAQKTVNAAKG